MENFLQKNILIKRNMKVIEKACSMREEIDDLRKKGYIIGFVPTMGYLHKGHIGLIRKAKDECDRVALSIFVNPTQFGPAEDLKTYPRDFKKDCQLAEKEGIDYIFYPSEEELYGSGYKTFVEVKDLSKIMCGRVRPDHFRGVCTVVLKLFNIVNPHKAYFGEKDYQQLVIIKKMVKDLNLFIEIRSCPTVREKDGLALSSRNKYLSKEERENASLLYRCLSTVQDMVNRGEKDLEKIKDDVLRELKENRFVKKVDYFDFRDATTLSERKRVRKHSDKILAALAVWIGNTRLIDNKIIILREA